jgi:hypothetical protein
MSDENPQDQQTVGPTVPKEPGEIGWHADADAPGDLSVPEPGSGGVGPYEPAPATPPNDGLLDEPAEPVAEKAPAAPAKVAYADMSDDDLRAEIDRRRALGQPLPDVRDASTDNLIALLQASDGAHSG